MIATGAPPFGWRHSIVGVVELNGANQCFAAGSLAAAVCVRPTDTVSRRSSSLLRSSRLPIPGQTRTKPPLGSLTALMLVQAFGALEV
ncbi:hypothetical protein X566_24365 [Afipia sp. P52-10]|nr:hypothetical protein X566_24365 [Afipia sp. P52-10]